MVKVVGKEISKKFNSRMVLRNISFDVQSGESLVITGPNGSGKTTLIKIICGLESPTGGEVQFFNQDKPLEKYHRHQFIGLVGPYLQLYNDLTAWENFKFFSQIRGLKANREKFLSLMKRFGLKGREMDELKAYSSGMLQRMKYVIALLHDPEILILDEPTSNLDEEGVKIVYQLMEEQAREKILILATNEPGEIKYGEKRLDVAH